MKRLIFALTVAALPLAAMAQTATGMSGSTTGMSTNNSTALSTQDRKFIKMAGIAGLSEVQAGQVAEQNGDASVKAVGERMVTDHTKANDQLATLSQQLGDPAPAALPATQRAMITKMQGMSGASFDTSYLKAQTAAHKNAIALFETEISKGSNAQLKQFASNTLPILKEHLTVIQSAMPS